MSDKIQAITMPKWGLAMTEGLVAAWHLKEGEIVNAGDEALDIETEKITNAYDSPVTGVLRRCVVSEGDTVPVGALLGVVAEASVPDGEVDAFIEQFREKFSEQPVDTSAGGVEPETLEVGTQRLRFLTLGDAQGPSVLLIHGFGGDLNNWLFNQPVLAESHTVVALDLPGHGASSKDVEGGGVDALADVVLEFLDAIDVHQVHLVGHSLGGAIAATLALRVPERIVSSTLISAAGLGEEINMDYINGFIQAGRRKELKPVVQALFADPQLVRRELIDDLLKYKRLDGVETALKFIAESAFASGRQALILRDRLTELRVPTQAIWGKDDRIIPVSHLGGLPERIGCHTLEGAGHMVHMEKSTEVNRLVMGFISDAE